MAANEQALPVLVQELRTSTTAIREGQAQVEGGLATLKARLGDSQNAMIRLLNKFAGPNGPLLPLVDPRTGDPIKNSPRCAAEIFALSAEEATRILQTLGVTIENQDEEWLRRAVMDKFL